jgi:hypothetical protein
MRRAFLSGNAYMGLGEPTVEPSCFAQSSKATMESRPCVDLFPLPFWQLFPPLLQSHRYRRLPLRQYRIATACKGAYGAIPAIASSPATPNAWRAQAVRMPIAGSTPNTRLRASGAVPIATDTEPPRRSALTCRRRFSLVPTMNRDAVCCGA